MQKCYFCSQEEANIGRQDDPPKVGFPIGFERFLLLNLNSFFGRFGNCLIFVKMPKNDADKARIGPNPAEVPRKNSALRKKGSEGYMAKQNRSKGTLKRKCIFERPLRAKGYMAKARKHSKTRLKLKSSSFLSEGYVDKGLFRKGISIRNFRRVYH